MIAAIEIDRDVDLALFSTFLRQQGIAHRINEEGNQQVIRVHSEEHAGYVRELYARFDRGEFRLESGARPQQILTGGVSILTQLRRVPATAVLILINLLLFPVTFGVNEGEVTELLKQMMFVPFEVQGQYVSFGDLGDVIAAGQYWRFLTPMFLHFGILHLVFNLLWVWEIGRRIEMMGGVSRLTLVVLISSLAANLLQYLMTGPSLFGGMSGVVFGLLGYALVWSRLVPSKDLGLPTGIYIFMLAFLVIGFSGAVDFLLPGTLANGAHLGGLIGGVVVGGLAVTLERLGSEKA